MSQAPRLSHIEPTQDAGRRFVQQGLSGPVVMLNLLRFRAVADYSADPDLAPAQPVSGAEAGTLKVRNRELEILIAQLRDALAAQTRWARLVAKATGNRYVSTLITKLKALLRP